ncbi:MAG: hypothetical protein AB7S90_11910 [Marinobacterium sp.]
MHTTPALVTTLMRQLEQQKGRINHMYRDTRGFITVGVCEYRNRHVHNLCSGKLHQQDTTQATT